MRFILVAAALPLCLLVSACSSENASKPVTPPSSESAPTLDLPDQETYETQVSVSGPLPGGPYDCTSGIWSFAIDLIRENGDLIQGESTTAMCADAVESDAWNANLWLDRKGRTNKRGEMLSFINPLVPIDNDAMQCVDLYGGDCRSRK